MKDSAARGIKNAKQAGQLRRDAAVQDKKSSIGKRDNYGAGLSSSNSSIDSINRINNTNIRNNLAVNSNQDAEAKKRIKRNQKLDKAIQVAEKIPIANKYAKVAKMAKKVTDAKQKKAGMFKNFFGGGNNNATNAEIEDANAAETKGEEYNPEDTEGRYSVKLDRPTKMILTGVIGGILLVNVLLCVIVVSSVTGGAKESYLASHDNPSESDIESAYNKDEESENSNSSSSRSSSSNNSSSSNTNSNNSSSNNSVNDSFNKIIVGDSRVVHLCQYVGGGNWNECNIMGVNKGGVTYIPGDGKSYDWFHSNALSEIQNRLKTNSKSIVFLYMGTNGLNDLVNQARGYANDCNQLAKDYPDSKIIAISETPIIDSSRDSAFESFYSDANIVKFNAELKKQLSSDVSYCDVYSKVKGKVNASDGIHYDSDSYKIIYNEIMNCSK